MAQPFLNITSSNAKVLITVEGLYDTAQLLENFSADTALAVDEQEIAQARMGVDGGLAVGYVPNPFNITLNFEAGSPSLRIMWDIVMAMRNNQTVYNTSIMAQIEALGQVYTWENGSMLSGTVTPAIKKTLDPASFKFAFSRMSVSNI